MRSILFGKISIKNVRYHWLFGVRRYSSPPKNSLYDQVLRFREQNSTGFELVLKSIRYVQASRISTPKIPLLDRLIVAVYSFFNINDFAFNQVFLEANQCFDQEFPSQPKQVSPVALRSIQSPDRSSSVESANVNEAHSVVVTPDQNPVRSSSVESVNMDEAYPVPGDSALTHSARAETSTDSPVEPTSDTATPTTQTLMRSPSGERMKKEEEETRSVLASVDPQTSAETGTLADFGEGTSGELVNREEAGFVMEIVAPATSPLSIERASAKPATSDERNATQKSLPLSDDDLTKMFTDCPDDAARKRLYYSLALKYHPDKNPAGADTELFQRIRRLYEEVIKPQQSASFLDEIDRETTAIIAAGEALRRQTAAALAATDEAISGVRILIHELSRSDADVSSTRLADKNADADVSSTRLADKNADADVSSTQLADKNAELARKLKERRAVQAAKSSLASGQEVRRQAAAAVGQTAHNISDARSLINEVTKPEDGLPPPVRVNRM